MHEFPDERCSFHTLSCEAAQWASILIALSCGSEQEKRRPCRPPFPNGLSPVLAGARRIIDAFNCACEHGVEISIRLIG
jgi:hypothetical protein